MTPEFIEMLKRLQAKQAAGEQTIFDNLPQQQPQLSTGGMLGNPGYSLAAPVHHKQHLNLGTGQSTYTNRFTGEQEAGPGLSRGAGAIYLGDPSEDTAENRQTFVDQLNENSVYKPNTVDSVNWLDPTTSHAYRNRPQATEGDKQTTSDTPMVDTELGLNDPTVTATPTYKDWDSLTDLADKKYAELGGIVEGGGTLTDQQQQRYNFWDNKVKTEQANKQYDFFGKIYDAKKDEMTLAQRQKFLSNVMGSDRFTDEQKNKYSIYGDTGKFDETDARNDAMGRFHEQAGLDKRPTLPEEIDVYLPHRPAGGSKDETKAWADYYAANPELKQLLSFDEQQDLMFMDHLLGKTTNKEYQQQSYDHRKKFGLDRHYMNPERDSHRFEYQYDVKNKYFKSKDPYERFQEKHQNVGGFFDKENLPGQSFFQEAMSNPLVGVALSFAVPMAAPALAAGLGVSNAAAAAMLGGGMSALKGGDIGDIIKGAAGGYIGGGGLDGVSGYLGETLGVSTDIADSIVRSGFELTSGASLEDALAAGLVKYGLSKGDDLAQFLKGEMGKGGVPVEELNEFDTGKYEDMYKEADPSIGGGGSPTDNVLDLEEIDMGTLPKPIQDIDFANPTPEDIDNIGDFNRGGGEDLKFVEVTDPKTGITYRPFSDGQIKDFNNELALPQGDATYGYTKFGDKWIVTNTAGEFQFMGPDFDPTKEFSLGGVGDGYGSEWGPATGEEWLKGNADKSMIDAGMGISDDEWQQIPGYSPFPDGADRPITEIDAGDFEKDPTQPQLPEDLEQPIEQPEFTDPIEQPEMPSFEGGGDGSPSAAPEAPEFENPLPPLETPPAMPQGGTVISDPTEAFDVFESISDMDPSLLKDTISDVLEDADLEGDAEKIAQQISNGETEGVPQEVVDGIEDAVETPPAAGTPEGSNYPTYSEPMVDRLLDTAEAGQWTSEQMSELFKQVNNPTLTQTQRDRIAAMMGDTGGGGGGDTGGGEGPGGSGGGEGPGEGGGGGGSIGETPISNGLFGAGGGDYSFDTLDLFKNFQTSPQIRLGQRGMLTK